MGALNVTWNVPAVLEMELLEVSTGLRPGTPSNAPVIGPAGQGIGVNEFAELVAAMRAGAAYANVHSAISPTPTPPPAPGTQFPGGEIRGQIH